jgi:hypothetical protein
MLAWLHCLGERRTFGLGFVPWCDLGLGVLTSFCGLMLVFCNSNAFQRLQLLGQEGD